MRIVVTGGTGFVGNRVLPLLVERGHAVTATVRGGGEPETPEVRWVPCDVADPGFVDLLPEAADVVVHLAQGDGPALEAVNVRSTGLLLDYARRAAATRFVLASSGSVYGGSRSSLDERRPVRPPDAYARSKADAEALLARAAPEIGVCALRLFAPYGPGQSGRLVADLVERVSSGRAVTLRGEGHPRLNPIFVDDVASVLASAVEQPVPPVLNVAGDEVLSIREMAETIGRVLGVAPNFEHAEGDPPLDLVADTTLLRATFALGTLTTFERGIAATVGASSGR